MCRIVVNAYLIAERLLHGIELIQGVDGIAVVGQVVAIAVAVAATEAVVAAAIATAEEKRKKRVK